jgi:hypothetical protein
MSWRGCTRAARGQSFIMPQTRLERWLGRGNTKEALDVEVGERDKVKVDQVSSAFANIAPRSC